MVRKTVFLHIGKTGGTSVHNALAKNLDLQSICPYRVLTPGHAERVTAEDARKYLLFSGHFYVPVLPAFVEAPICMTFLRNPLDHVKSGVRQAINEKTDLWRNAIGHVGPIRALRELPHVFHNMQCRTIHRFLYEDAWTFEIDHGCDSMKILDRVMRKLDVFDVVGLVEQAQESLSLYNSLGGCPAGVVGRNNISVSSFDGAIPDDLLVESCSMDLALYTHAKTLLARKQERLSDAIWLDMVSREAPKRVAATGRPQFAFGSGWYLQEPVAGGGDGRWNIGVERARIRAFASEPGRRGHRLELKIPMRVIGSDAIAVLQNDARLELSVRHMDAIAVLIEFTAFSNDDGVIDFEFAPSFGSFYERDQTSAQIEPRGLFLEEVHVDGVMASLFSPNC